MLVALPDTLTVGETLTGIMVTFLPFDALKPALSVTVAVNSIVWFPWFSSTVKASNLTSIALTKVDVLSGLEELQICYAYEYQSQTIDCAYPGIDLSKVKPLYRNLEPFTDDFKTDKLSDKLETYIKTIEEFIGIKVGIVAYGPERSEIKFRKDYF